MTKVAHDLLLPGSKGVLESFLEKKRGRLDVRKATLDGPINIHGCRISQYIHENISREMKSYLDSIYAINISKIRHKQTDQKAKNISTRATGRSPVTSDGLVAAQCHTFLSPSRLCIKWHEYYGPVTFLKKTACSRSCETCNSYCQREISMGRSTRQDMDVLRRKL